jgi:hypothetical protein
MTTRENLDQHYTYHAPSGNDVEHHRIVPITGRYFAEVILENVPCSDERDAAIACNKEDHQ